MGSASFALSGFRAHSDPLRKQPILSLDRYGDNQISPANFSPTWTFLAESWRCEQDTQSIGGECGDVEDYFHPWGMG